MQWSGLGAWCWSLRRNTWQNLPYSIYSESNFWSDNPTLVLIRVGVILAIMAGAYVWTAYCAGPSWSWMQCLGKNSLIGVLGARHDGLRQRW